MNSTSTTPSHPPLLIQVDSSAPATYVRVRLANGNLETVHLNESHTVLQLIQHVQYLSQSGSQPFSLKKGFPPKPLWDTPASALHLTIKQADLCKATIVQTLN